MLFCPVYAQIISTIPPDPHLGSNLSSIVVEEKIKDTRLTKIANCESGLQQFHSDGTVIIGPTADVGVMQINSSHWAEAEKMGLDIFGSEEDNITYGLLLFKRNGYSPWVCNKKV